MLRKRHNGFSLIEVVIGVTIISLSLFGLITALLSMSSLEVRSLRQTQSAYLLEEGLEAIRFLRNNDWETIANLEVGADYWLIFSNDIWTISQTENQINNLFDRRLNIEAVYRDSDFKIQETGTLDPDTKKITITVSWPHRGATTTRTISTYLTNIFSS